MIIINKIKRGGGIPLASAACGIRYPYCGSQTPTRNARLIVLPLLTKSLYKTKTNASVHQCIGGFIVLSNELLD